MPYRVRTTAQAERDLEHIYCFIEAETSQRAAKWFNGLCAAIGTLREMPLRLPVAPENTTLRHLLYGDKPDIYRIIFQVDESERIVNVLTVRHGARRPYKVRKDS
jgi:plasmid stabilization system protein ParE